jgi:plastocyanin
MPRAVLVLLLAFLACGDEEPIIQRPQRSTPVQAVNNALGEKTGVVHEVQMVGDISAGFRFEPSELTIKVGDTVRWVNASGFPHNVAFYADSIPNGANVIIEAVMPAEDKLGPMIGRIMSESGDAFEMDFLSVPSGTYRYFSIPQEAEGMLGTLIVESQ